MKYVSHGYCVSGSASSDLRLSAGFSLIGARNIHSTHTGGVHINIPEGFCDEFI
jgi:hypothetical protein